MAHKKGSVFTEMLKENIRGVCQACSKHGTKVRDHLGGGGAPVQHCHVWLCSALEPACQPPTGQSFLCSSTIMYKTHYHRNKEGGAQTRMSFQSLSSLLPKQTVSASGRSTLKSLLMTPFLTQTYSHIPRGDTLCVWDVATDLQKQVIIKLLQ